MTDTQRLAQAVRLAAVSLAEVLDILKTFHKDQSGAQLRLQVAIDGLKDVNQSLWKDLN